VRRIVLALVVAGFVAGCGSGFKDESEELRYLGSLSNPSPEQWKRREELNKKRADEEEARAQAALAKAKALEAAGKADEAALAYSDTRFTYKGTKASDEASEALYRIHQREVARSQAPPK
jgi:hypothetical protein